MGVGGAERVMANLASILSNRGHEVTISVNKTLLAFDVSEKVNIVYARKETTETKGKGAVKLIRRFRNFMSYFSHVKEIIKTSKPDVIISFMHCNLFQILLYHHGIPVVSSERTAMDNKWDSIGKRLLFTCNKFADGVTVLTQYDKGYAVAKGFKNVVVIPNPLTWPTINEQVFEETFPARKNILACGRVYAWHVKGFDLLIKAFALIAKKYPDWSIDIAGEGNEASFQIMCKLAEDNGVGGRINFLGLQKNVREVMMKHAIFVLSSRIEGFPNALSEAMTSGMAVVSYDRLANSIINDTIDGLLVENQNIEKLSNAIEKLIQNQELRYQFGKNAIKNINRFSMGNVVEKWELLFESLINKQ